MKVLLPSRARIPRNDIHGKIIFEAIREGLSPFKARTINLHFEYDIDYRRYRLFADVYFDHFRLAHRVFIDAFDLANNLEGEIEKAAADMLKGFRNREDFAVPNNIFLGEY